MSLPAFQADMQLWAEDGGDFNNELYTGFDLSISEEFNTNVGMVTLPHDDNEKPTYAFYVVFEPETTLNTLNAMRHNMVMEIHKIFNIDIDSDSIIINIINFG